MSGNRRFAASVGVEGQYGKSHYFTDGFTSHIRGWRVGVEVRANREDGKYEGPSKDQDSVSFDIKVTGGSLGLPVNGPTHIGSVSYDKRTGKHKIEIAKPGTAWVVHGGYGGTEFKGIFWTIEDVRSAFPGREWSGERNDTTFRANPNEDDSFALWADLYATNEEPSQIRQVENRRS